MCVCVLTDFSVKPPVGSVCKIRIGACANYLCLLAQVLTSVFSESQGLEASKQCFADSFSAYFLLISATVQNWWTIYSGRNKPFFFLLWYLM